MKAHNQLPEPDELAKAQSAALSQKIQTALTRHKQLSFANYMQMALYSPGLGYYASPLPKIGERGDFITAPEVSPLFSRCLARQVAQILVQLKSPNILEFGAGKGTMAKDILLELAQLNQPIERYYILEISSDLKQRQHILLQNSLPSELFAKVVWLSELPKTPISAVVLANEVLDAMPFERLRIEPHQALKAYVTYQAEHQRFEWLYQPITERPLQQFANQLIQYIGQPSSLGYETEINLHLEPWLKSLNDIVAHGAVLIIDYGYTRNEYYQPARVMGTLRCHYQHRAHSNPFFYPGLQDITAHVDFTAVAEAGFKQGFKVAGFSTQAHFLMSAGLLDMANNLDASVTEQIQLAQQIKTLTLPNEMGETFKVMALTKQIDAPLIGFSLRDLRHQL